MTRELKRYKIGYSSDEWGMNRSLGLIADQNGEVCRFADVKAEIDRLGAQQERKPLQAEGTHPAPCARHCEASAFKIEIRRLEVVINSWLRANAPGGWIDDLRKEVAQQERKPDDAYRIDAERYRWLRGQNARLEQGTFYVGIDGLNDEDDIKWVGSDLDSVIDEAMKETP